MVESPESPGICTCNPFLTVTQGTGRHLLPSNTQSCQQPVISAKSKKKKCFPRLDPSLDFTCFMKVIWKLKFKLLFHTE